MKDAYDTHYVRNRVFDAKGVLERFRIGAASFGAFLQKNKAGGYDVGEGERLARVAVTEDGIIEIVDIRDEKGLLMVMMAMMGVGLTVNDVKPYPGEYTWGTSNGKQHGEPEAENWDARNLRIITAKPTSKPVPLSVITDAKWLKPKPESVFLDRPEEHARHIIPIVCVPGRVLGIPSVPMLPIIMLSKMYDGFVGQSTKAFYNDDCCSNWFGFRLGKGKMSFSSDLRYFEGRNVYDDEKVAKAFGACDLRRSITTLVSTIDESPRTLLSTSANALTLCNPTPTKQVKYDGKHGKAITKSGAYRALCRINAAVLPAIDGDIVYFINDACDALLVTLDIT